MEKPAPEPLISVIVPAYNQALFLPEALDSVAAQTYTNWECIIVNDGSPDHTEDIALQYAAADKRFKYISKENGGLSSARNAGLDAASGDWIQFLDADDYITPDKFALSLDCLNTQPATNIIISDFKMFVEDRLNATPAFCELNQNLLNFDDILMGWGAKFTIPIHCGLFSRHLFQHVRFNVQFKALEDWLMWLEIFRTNTRALFLAKPMAYYRNNPTSMTKDKTAYRASVMQAYTHILTLLDHETAVRFGQMLINRLAANIDQYEKDIAFYRSKFAYRAERYVKDTLKKLITRKPKH